MKRKTLLFLPLILGLLALLVSIKIITRNDNYSGDRISGSGREVASDASLESDIKGRSSSKRDREDAEYKKSLQEMEREFDEILPAQYPDHYSSLCDVTLKLGENLIIGGFKRADGNFEFSSLIVEEVMLDGNTQRLLRTRIFTMSGERVTEFGLDPLVSPAKKRIQQSIVFAPGDLSWLYSADHIMTAPSMALKPSQSRVLNMNERKAFAISVITDPGSDGNSLRLRTRLERSSEALNP